MARRRQDRADDLDRLRRFQDRTRYVQESELVRRGGVEASLTFGFQQGSPWTWTSKEPRDELLEPLLLRLRPMIAQDDINVFGIHNICDQRLDHAEMRAFLRSVRQEWSKAQRVGIMGFKVNEREMRPDHVADLMINGHYFHAEPTKARELAELVGESRPISRHIFIGYVYSAIETVFATGDVVRIGLERDMFGAT